MSDENPESKPESESAVTITTKRERIILPDGTIRHITKRKREGDNRR